MSYYSRNLIIFRTLHLAFHLTCSDLHLGIFDDDVFNQLDKTHRDNMFSYYTDNGGKQTIVGDYRVSGCFHSSKNPIHATSIGSVICLKVIPLALRGSAFITKLKPLSPDLIYRCVPLSPSQGAFMGIHIIKNMYFEWELLETQSL